MPDPDHDSIVFEKFNRTGKLVQIQRNTVTSYIPNIDPTQTPIINTTASPIKLCVLNAFNEKIATCTLVDAKNTIYRTTLYSRDALGEEIATVDANGIAKITMRDTRGYEISTQQFATSIASDDIPAIGASYASLQTLLTSLSDITKDHVTQTDYDVIHQVTSTARLNVVTQSINGNDFSDNPAQSLSTIRTYTKDKKIKSITYPNGQSEIFYYDARRNLIAKAFIPRTQVAPDGTTTIIRPITYYQVSAHGDHVVIYQPAGGCTPTLDPTSETPPSPISIAGQDRFYILLRDAKRRVLMKQDPENNVEQLTYYAAGKTARRYYALTNANPTAKNFRITHLDEHHFEYDALQRKTVYSLYRDLIPQNTHTYQYDAFALIAEGPGDGTWPVQHRYDLAQRRFLTTNAAGGIQLIGYNLADDKTVTIESLTQDLSTTTADQLITVMQKRDDVTNYEFTETVFDFNGKPLAFVEPGYSDNSTIVRPLYQLGWNNFGKKNKSVLPSGDTTLFEHDLQSKLTKQTEPAISVMDEKGVASSVNPVTVIGHDTLGKKIGVRDTNNHTELFYRNEASEVVTHTAGDGTPYFTNTLDVYGQTQFVTSASKNTWQKIFTRKGKVTQVITPSKDTWTYALNDRDFVAQTTPPTGSATGVTYDAQDIYGNLSAHYLPMGESHLYTRDRHRGILSHQAINIDGSTAYTITMQRDFFGKLTKKTDGTGSVYGYTYYQNGMPYQELGVSTTGHGDLLSFDSTTNTFTQTQVAVPLKNITYQYATSLRQTQANTLCFALGNGQQAAYAGIIDDFVGEPYFDNLSYTEQFVCPLIITIICNIFPMD